MSEENAVGICLILSCIWFGWPLHMIAADIRWIKTRIKDTQP